MDILDKFEKLLDDKESQIKKMENIIKKQEDFLKQDISDVKRELIEQHITDGKNRISKIRSSMEFMRLPSKEDDDNRAKLMKEFAPLVNEFISDENPIVFHGTNNIGIVREILKSGGLFTPEQRGISYESFATQIDVTYKKNIKTTCEFADAGKDSFLPYGAIFAFLPQKDEEEKVFATNSSSEVENGVAGVNFREEPNRLIAIITTSENIDRVKTWCHEYGHDPEKVFTHEKFIDFCKEKLAPQNIVEDKIENE